MTKERGRGIPKDSPGKRTPLTAKSSPRFIKTPEPGRNSHSGRPRGPRPWENDLRRLYVLEGLAVREVAARLGVSKDLVHRALKELGIERRSCLRRSGVTNADPARILSEVIDRGAEGAAEALGVSRRTMFYHLKRIRGGCK